MTTLVKKLDSNVVVIELNQKGGNKFTEEMLNQLYKDLSNYSMENARGIIITGSGKAFSVGGDLQGMKKAMELQNPSDYVDTIVPVVNKIIVSILSHELPVVAAINGGAAGGGLSLALSADYRISVPDAKLSMAFGKLALTPDSGSSVIFRDRFGLTRSIVGVAKGEILLAKDVVDSGVIHMLAENADLISEAESFILDVTSESQWSFAKTKQLMNHNLIQDTKAIVDLELKTIKQSSVRREFEDKLNTLLERFQ